MILTVKSVALTADREVPVDSRGDVVALFEHEMRQAAIEVVRKLSKKFRRLDIEVEVY